MEKLQKRQQWLCIFLIGTYLLSMLLSFIFYGFLGGSLKRSYQIGLFSCVFLLPLWLYLYNTEWELKKPKTVLLLGLLFFGFTMSLILISIYINTYLLWIGGCVFLTVLFPTRVGIGFFLFFGCLFCFINKATIPYKIFLFLLGIILCSLVFFIKKGKSKIFIVLIFLIAYTLLFFGLTYGSHAYFERQSLISMIGQAIFLIMAYPFYALLKETDHVFFL